MPTPPASPPAPPPVTLSVAGRPFDLTLAIGDHASLVGIFQAHPVAAPFNDHANLRRMTTALLEMVMQFAEAGGITDPEEMIKFAQGLVRDEFHPLHAARQEARAQRARPS